MLYFFFVLSFVLPCVVNAWEGRVVFQDDFTGSRLDRNTWTIDTGCAPLYGPNDLQCYQTSQRNVKVENGYLKLTATLAGGGKYNSGRIHQSGRGLTYGAYVAKMRLPKGKHLWPAFWMLPSKETDGCVHEEIDIMEYRGQKTSTIEWTAYFGKDYNHMHMNSIDHDFNIDFSADFHEFAVLWTPSNLEWFVDTKSVYKLPTDYEFWTKDEPENRPCKRVQPFSEPFYIILNLAVGGDFFPPVEYGNLTEAEARRWPKPVVEVDWVKVYQS